MPGDGHPPGQAFFFFFGGGVCIMNQSFCNALQSAGQEIKEPTLIMSLEETLHPSSLDQRVH